MKMQMRNTGPTTANRNDEVVVQIFDKPPTTTVINIPADVIIEILSRLPARSIGRLRCLSKSWLSISSSHNFIKSYSQRSTNHNSIIIKRKNRTKFHFASINSNAPSGFFLHKPTKNQRILNTIVEASWNGFLLLRHFVSDHHSLFNPLTSQFINLPYNCQSNSFQYLCLYLHRPTSKYRLIRLSPVEFWRKSEVLVVGQSNWRIINSRLPRVQHHPHPVEFASRLYWLASHEENVFIRISRDPESIPNTIITFDTVTETYNLLPLPRIKKTRSLGGNLVDFHGELGLWNIGSHFLDLWIMERKCPFSQRVLLTLEEKHLPYDLKLVDLANRPEWFLKVSPEGKVPVAKLDDKWIADSDIITQTIEEKFPEPPLATPLVKSSVGSKLFSTFIAFLKSTDSNDGTEKALLSELTSFEEYLRGNGPFVNGEKISSSDLSLGPKLYHLEIVLNFYKNWSVPVSFTHVRNYMELVFSRESFVKTRALKEDVIAGWRAKVAA